MNGVRRHLAATYRDYAVPGLLLTAISSHVLEKSTYLEVRLASLLDARSGSMQLNFKVFTKSSACLEGNLPVDTGSKGL